MISARIGMAAAFLLAVAIHLGGGAFYPEPPPPIDIPATQKVPKFVETNEMFGDPANVAETDQTAESVREDDVEEMVRAKSEPTAVVPVEDAPEVDSMSEGDTPVEDESVAEETDQTEPTETEEAQEAESSETEITEAETETAQETVQKGFLRNAELHREDK